MISLDKIIKASDKILIVAPHPDDETIGLGGLLVLYGKQVEVLVLTDGSKGNNSALQLTTEQLMQERKNELQKALSFTKVSKVYYLGIVDKEVEKSKKKIFSFDFSSYNLVFVPNRNEAHEDHFFAFKYVKQTINRYKTILMEYEIWSPISRTNCFLNISEVIETKIQMISQYKTQILSNDYNKLVNGLNSYRGALVHKNYVEAFYMTLKKSRFRTSKLFINTIKRIIGKNK